MSQSIRRLKKAFFINKPNHRQERWQALHLYSAKLYDAICWYNFGTILILLRKLAFICHYKMIDDPNFRLSSYQ